MPPTQDAQRLQIDTRLLIQDNISALRAQRSKAREKGDRAAAEKLQEQVEDLLDQLDELSAISLDRLEDSDVVKDTVRDLRRIADGLQAEAANIKDVQSALEQGAQAVQRFTNLVTQLRSLAP